MVQSPDISEETLNKALHSWNNSLNLENFNKFETGRARTVFNLETSQGKELICYLCTKESVEERFKSEEKLLEILKQKTSIKVPEILHSDFSCQEIPYLFYIAEKIEGYTPDKRYKHLPKTQRKQILRQLGSSMAELHQEVKFEKSGRLKYNQGEIKIEGTTFQEFLEEWVEKWVEKMGEGRFSDLQTKCRNFFEKNKELIKEEDSSCVHFDMKPDNLIFKDGELEAILDWEKAISGPPEWDLQYSMVLMAYAEFQKESLAEEMSLELFKGYLNNRKLDDNWKKRLLYYNMIWSFKGMVDIEKIEAESQQKQMEETFREMLKKRNNDLDEAVKQHHINEL